jgi:hypothetical protein
MPANRRNYYRLLHIQADAPVEVIKASYRALMKLHHPDHGGEHANAVLINEAYAVLSDPAKRTAYDITRAPRAARSAPPQDASARSNATHNSSNGATSNGTSSHRAARNCPLCALPLPAEVHATSRCARCRAPLAPVRHNTGRARNVERRSMPRVTKSDWALLYQNWPSEVLDVRMRDLSLDGISVYSGAEVPVDRAVRVVGASFDVVAHVVTTRRVGKVFTLHAKLITALFSVDAGGFVSTTA